MAHSDERIYSQLDLRIRLARSDWTTESVGNLRAILAGSSNPGTTWVTSAKSAFFGQVDYFRFAFIAFHGLTLRTNNLRRVCSSPRVDRFGQLSAFFDVTLAIGFMESH
jgi:hypothetical protein